MDFVAFGLILDDIVSAEGQVEAGVLGGGGPQSAFGMRLWSERVGLAASVGRDLPDSAWTWLRAAGIDTAGVRVTDLPSLRAWQRLGPAGGRRHAWQVSPDVVAAHLRRSVSLLPEAYRRARGFHVGLHPDEPDLSFLRDLRAREGAGRPPWISVEPFRSAAQLPSPDALQALLTACDIFSPDLAEARSLVGPGEPPELIRRLREAGAGVVVVRMGTRGSLAADARSAAHVPAVPVRVVDEVGAGNAYGGGFLAGWAETGDVREAGLRGAVAASFMLEQVGLPAFTRDAFDREIRAEAQRRLRDARLQVTGLNI